MWIVILNFSVFVLLICFMFYGFSKWSRLITEYSDYDEEEKDSNKDADEQKNVTDMFYYILPFWILIFGITLNQLIGYIQYLLGY